MFRLTGRNIQYLRPDLTIWPRGHLNLDSKSEQLCYFWTQEEELITRQNIEQFYCPIIAHPSDHPTYIELPSYLGKFNFELMAGRHLYRLCVEPDCVAAPSGHGFKFDRTGLREYATLTTRLFIRPDGVMPVEVTYLGTAPHED